ncbi:MAG: 30S ribosomal protein S2 [Candidatus Magasanikbacteria bacterium]|nr:30S ribosomal protein S2 [Candidatus Magasanikbacteria bacterium]
MRDITLEELLEAGCHFGHQVNRQNPKAQEFIFEARNNVHIINLEQTREGLLSAAEFVKKVAASDGTIVIVGTKRQIRPVVEEEVARARKEGARNLHYVTSRWIGGVLTNFSEVSKNFKRLGEIENILSDKNSGYTKREKLLMEREREKLLNFYEGVRDLKKMPELMFIVDTHHEATAVYEAGRMKIDRVGIVDTNADPAGVEYSIPSNDDAVGAVKLLTSYIIDAWIEGQTETDAANAKKEAAAAAEAEKSVEEESAPKTESKPKSKTAKKE